MITNNTSDANEGQSAALLANPFPYGAFDTCNPPHFQPIITQPNSLPAGFDTSFHSIDAQAMMATALFGAGKPNDELVFGKGNTFGQLPFSGFTPYIPTFPSTNDESTASAYDTAARLANPTGVAMTTSTTTFSMDEVSYNDFLASLVNEDGSDEPCPGLEPDLAEFDSTTAAFDFGGPVANPEPSEFEQHDPSASHHFKLEIAEPSPSPVAAPSPAVEDHPTASTSFEDHSPPIGGTPGPSSSSSTTRTRHRKATGFRGPSTTLISLTAPIQTRTYAIDSCTSKKRKTTAVERKLAKRVAQGIIEEIPEDEAEIPEDLLAAAEKKRISNTLSARKSRARKQERLGELEVENTELRGENEKLSNRVAELEKMLRDLGVSA